jgi:hypothetical protein
MSLGLIREAFSIGALGAAVIAVRVWNEPFCALAPARAGAGCPPDLAPWVAGVCSRWRDRGGRHLRPRDAPGRARGRARLVRSPRRRRGRRAEGAIAAGVLLLAIGGVLGRDHALLTGSRSFALLSARATRPRCRATRARGAAAARRA